MKTIIRNSTHIADKSHDCLIAEIEGKKIKFTYEAYNATEKCTTEFFDGYKWNFILSMLDLGIEPNRSAYSVWNENERKIRADDLFKMSEIICNYLIINNP